MTFLRFLLTVFILAFVLGCGQGRQSSDDGRYYSIDRLEDLDRQGSITRHYTWQDINSLKILGQKGDKYLVDGKSKALNCRLRATIDPVRLKDVIGSFGVAESLLAFSYTSEEDFRRKRKQMERAVAEKGFAYLPQRNALTPDYDWIVKNSVRDMKETAVRLQSEAKRLGYQDARRFHGMMASFVQSMPYKMPPAARSDAVGRKIFIGGVTMPLETLYRGYGDCDTKSVLFASILKNFRGTDVVFLAGNQHMFAAVPMEPRMYDSYILLKGKKYLLIELTQPWHLGHVPREHLHALRLKKLEVMHLAE